MYVITKAMRETVAKSGLYIPGDMLSMNADAKTVKGVKKGYLTGIMYLAPSYELCPSSKAAGCDKACLFTAGRGKFNSVQQGRINKTKLLEQHEEIAMIAIARSINKVINRAKVHGMLPAIRLNGTSDIDWTSKTLNGKTLFELFPDVQFYDYSKVPSNVRKANKYANYHVTISYSNMNSYTPVMQKMAGFNNNIAVVFRGKLPETFMGLPVINGDETDLRFLDNEVYQGQVVVGLTAKGDAKKDDGFVVNTNIIAMAA